MIKHFHSVKILPNALKAFTIFFAATVLSVYYSYSQNDTLYFGHFGTAEGMSNNNVSCIIQDQLGYMWYGTQDGLNKFDGYGFTIFHHDPKNENSLVSDAITCMTAGKAGMIWMGTAKGLNKYDTYSGVFTLYRHRENDLLSISGDSITCMFADSSGIIWVGTVNSGLNAFNAKTSTFKRFKHQLHSNSLASDQITCIGSDGRGILWIGTKSSGVNRFDTHSGDFTVYRSQKQNSNCISSNDIRDIHVDRSKRVWIATANGLNQFDPLTGKFTQYRHDDHNPFSIVSNNITSVFQDKYGKIWAGTEGMGVNVYYEESNQFLLYIHDNDQLNSLSSNKINSISQGRSGMMWIATADGGLNAFNPKSLKFNLFNPLQLKIDHEHSECITSMVESSDGILWIGSIDDGITEYNRTDKSFAVYREPESTNFSPGENRVNCMLMDHQSVIWFGTNEGLFIINPITGKISSKNSDYLTPQLQDAQPSLSRIRALAETNNHLILIGTSGGLFVYNPETKNSDLYQHESSDITSIGSNAVTTITCADKTIWIGTWGGGLNAFDPSTRKFTVYKHNESNPNTIGSDYIKSICVDSKGNIWIGTQGGGLNVLDQITNKFKCYTSFNGLPANTVNGILEDSSSNIWIGTDYGICRLSFDSFGVLHPRLYDVKDGLPTPQFGQGACLKTKDGHMLFSCCKGIISFDPQSINPNWYRPPVVITDFRLFYQPVLPGDASGILSTSISVTKDLRLSYDQNVFSFEFTAISFINPEKNNYAFKMDGFDKDWNYANYKNRVATYTNLPPGEYDFRVKASNNDGIWNEEGTTVHISIRPPFWSSPWFIVSVIVSVCILIFLVIWLRTRRLQNQKLLLENAVEQRTIELKEQKNRAEVSEKFKEQFVANMSHEIRTPMNAVMGMTQLVLDGKLSLQQRKYMNAIRHSSENLLVLLDDILDLSKLEAGKMELEYIPFRLSEQLQFIFETFELKATEKSLSFKIEPCNKLHDILIGDPTRLTQVLINLVGNAIKFTEQGEVRLICNSKEYSDEMVKVEFIVKDSGIGIAQERLNVIFDSFAQATPEICRKYGGTGLGLTISKQLVEKQGGVFKVNSSPGTGSEFTFSLTYAKGDESTLLNFSQTKLSIDPDSLNGIRILLAEDNFYNQIVTEDTLRKMIKDVTIETALNGKEVIKWLQRERFDIILMDMQMPEMDGYEAANYIRKQMPEPICLIPIIALTASAIKTELKKCLEAGMNGCIVKPFVRKDLLEQMALFYKGNGTKSSSDEEQQVIPQTNYTDLTELTHLTDGDVEQMENYIRLFLESVSLHTNIIKDAIEQRDFNTISKSVHALKSQIKLMGIHVIEPVIENIEEDITKKKDLLVVKNVNYLLETCSQAAEELRYELVH